MHPETASNLAATSASTSASTSAFTPAEARIVMLVERAEYFHARGDALFAALHAEAAIAEAVLREASLASHIQSRLEPVLASADTQYAQKTALITRAKTAALEARTRAHAPFSNFLVGAALIADDATMVEGCNVEASSYGLTICAERTALVSAVAQGKKRFAAVVVAADTPVLTPPCGACRQMLYDFAPDAVVILVNPQGSERRFTMRELLPEAFSVAFLT
jgi:cytidine deaminase